MSYKGIQNLRLQTSITGEFNDYATENMLLWISQNTLQGQQSLSIYLITEKQLKLLVIHAFAELQLNSLRFCFWRINVYHGNHKTFHR